MGATAATPAPVPALSEMSVRDMIDASPVAAILDKPIGEVLRGLGLGLPTVPPIPPLPGLPPLPVIDIGLLVTPIAHLLGGFGSGDLRAGNLDPTAIFKGLSTVLETAMTVGKGALKLADQLWVGHSSVAATAKTTQAGVNSAQLATQGSGMSLDIQAAAAIVASGLAAVQAILAATLTKIAAAIPLVPTGAGLPLMGGFAAEGLAEATAAVALTRAQLVAPTMQMTVNGAPVPVTAAPTPAGAAPQSPFALAATILDTVSPMVTTAVDLPATLMTPLSKLIPKGGAPQHPPGHPRKRPDLPTPGPPGPGGTMPASLTRSPGVPRGGVGVGGIAGTLAPLSPARPSVIAPAIGATEPASLTQSAVAKPVTTAAAPLPASMAPMAAAGAARAGGGGNGGHDVPDYLVTEDNGLTVVGDVADVAPAVLGADEPNTVDTNDIEFRLGLPAPRA